MRKGEKMSDELKKKIRQSNIGKKHNLTPQGLQSLKNNGIGGWNKDLKCSDEWKEKIRLANIGKKHSEETKQKHRDLFTGKKNPRWKGGKKFWKESEYKHLSSKYIDWMLQVKKRDLWKCRINNSDCNGKLEAHHILNWVDYPELRYEVNNGITLCHHHHPRKRKDEIKLATFFTGLALSQPD